MRNSGVPSRDAIGEFCGNRCAKERLINYISLDVISAGLLSGSRGGSIYLRLIFYILSRDNFKYFGGEKKIKRIF